VGAKLAGDLVTLGESKLKPAQVKELLLQSLEHERGGIKVYETALECVINDDLKEEWEKYLGQTRNHERILVGVLGGLKLDPEEPSPGRAVVKLLGTALVQAMESALKAGNPTAAELVACECVTLAETKDHADWPSIPPARRRRFSKTRPTRLKIKRTSTCTTPKAGAASCGYNPSA
jgi:hypothetical protein